MARKKPRPSNPKPPTSTTTKPQSIEKGAPQGSTTAIQETSKLVSPASTGGPNDINGLAAKTSTAITNSPKNPSIPASAVKADSKKEPEPDWVRVVKKMANILGSLQLAVILLTLFASVVFLGTLMEHWYNTKIAQELVYRAWWFNFLLFMLASTIFFAAAKKMKFNKEPLHLPSSTATTFFGKVGETRNNIWATMSHFWPWKRHQFGFIVTHIGLITMLTGGLVNNWYGTDAYVQLIDTRDPEALSMIQARYKGTIPQSTDYCLWSDIAELKVTEKMGGNDADPHGFMKPKGQASDDKTYAQDFWGGVFPWKSRPAKEAAPTNTLLTVMNFLQSPLGQSWSMYMDNGARLEVIDFIPLARQVPFAAADEGSAAFQLQLYTPMIKEPLDTWVSMNWMDPERVGGFGPARVESLGLVRAALISEFLNPPSVQEMGTKGVLAVHVAGETLRVPVEKHWKTKKDLGKGWSVQINRFIDDPKDLQKKHERELVQLGGPALELTLWNPDQEQSSLVVYSRLPEIVWDQEKQNLYGEGVGGNPSFFFHAPELNQGQDRGGVLQFVQSGSSNLYYRTLTKADDKAKVFSLEKAGKVDLDNNPEYPIWKKMGWRFRIAEYLPHAKHTSDYAPVHIAPGKETNRDKEIYPSVVHLRLSVPNGKTREFWLQKGQIIRNMQVGDRAFTVSYSYKEKPLGFKLLLERAEQTVDPGTGSPASYSSYVQLFDGPMGYHGKTEVITMNEPLVHRGLTFYQSNYEFTGFFDASGKPVSISGFTVGSDPGIGLKYAGSLMLALGIAIMFYMKAYFFKPRRRPTSAEGAPAG